MYKCTVHYVKDGHIHSAYVDCTSDNEALAMQEALCKVHHATKVSILDMRVVDIERYSNGQVC